MGHDAVHANNSQKYGNSAKNSKKREVDPVPQRLIRRIVFHGPNVIHRQCAIDFSNDRPHCWNDLCSAGIGTNDKVYSPKNPISGGVTVAVAYWTPAICAKRSRISSATTLSRGLRSTVSAPVGVVSLLILEKAPRGN